MRTAPQIVLTGDERSKLEMLAASGKTSARLRDRSSMVLLAAQGLSNQQIAAQTGHDPGKVGRWRARYLTQGIAGIRQDKSRPGRLRPLSQAKQSEVLHLTLHSKPQGATHWSRASMAKAAGISETSVGRIWAAHGVKPHRVKSFKLSNDKNFEGKLRDIIGLYQSPRTCGGVRL